MKREMFLYRLAKRLRLASRLCALCAIVGLMGSCQKADSTYASLPAYFTMENIYQAPVLYAACYSMGEFCTITTQGNTFVFSGIKSTSAVNRTALNNYTGFYLGLSGFIVGLPNIPEMGQDNCQVVCFDLACSHCYQEYSITKKMELQEGGYSYCASCHRKYNLNNLGIVSEGEAGRPLYRYRVTLLGNTLVIANR